MTSSWSSSIRVARKKWRSLLRDFTYKQAKSSGNLRSTSSAKGTSTACHHCSGGAICVDRTVPFVLLTPLVSHLQSQLRFGLHGFPSSSVHVFRGTEDVSWKTEDILEELVQHHELGSLQSYLEKVRYKEVCPLNTDRSRSNFCVLI